MKKKELKRIRGLLITSVLSLGLLCLAGCGSSRNPQTGSGNDGMEKALVGTWELGKNSQMGWWAEIIFYEDGTVELTDENEEAEWSLDGDQLTFTYYGYDAGTEVFTISMEDDEHMTLKNGKRSAEYEKQEDASLGWGGED